MLTDGSTADDDVSFRASIKAIQGLGVRFVTVSFGDVVTGNMLLLSGHTENMYGLDTVSSSDAELSSFVADVVCVGPFAPTERPLFPCLHRPL